MAHESYPKIVYQSPSVTRLLATEADAETLAPGVWYEDPEGREVFHVVLEANAPSVTASEDAARALAGAIEPPLVTKTRHDARRPRG